jgi:hypothetical protein
VPAPIPIPTTPPSAAIWSSCVDETPRSFATFVTSVAMQGNNGPMHKYIAGGTRAFDVNIDGLAVARASAAQSDADWY